MGTFAHLVLARHLQIDVDPADSAVKGQETPRKPRLPQGGGADPGALVGITDGGLVHEFAYQDIVAEGPWCAGNW